MRKWMVSLSLAMLAVLVLTMPAAAGRKWCARDPIVALNGHEMQMWVGIPEEYVSLVTGAVEVRISVPSGVNTQTLFLDAGFNGFGEKVTYGTLTTGKLYANGAFDIQIQAKVPINTKKLKRMPLQLTINFGGDATETAPGVWTYAGGESIVVEMFNDGTTLNARFTPPTSAP